MSQPTFPSIRQTNGVPGKPAFITDIILSTQGIVNAILAIANVSNPGFAILSGFVDNGTTGFSGGYVILNNNVYYCSSTVLYGKYLLPNITDQEPKLHSDGNVYYTYKQYQVSIINSPAGGCSPQLLANTIDNYRIDLSTIHTNLINEITARNDSEISFFKIGESSIGTPITIANGTPVNETETTPYTFIKRNVTGTYNGLAVYNLHLAQNSINVLLDITATIGLYGLNCNIYSYGGNLLCTLAGTFPGTRYKVQLLQFSNEVWSVQNVDDIKP